MSKKLTNNDLIWIGVDFDKTLADNSGYPDYKIKKPMPGAVEAMKKLNKLGWKIIINTARGYENYEMIESWCLKYKIPFRRIICGKPLVRWMIDDRNIEFNGDWDAVLDKIK